MNKALISGLAGAVLAVSVPAFAQGPFADVPVDHWAYEAVQQLQDKGIVIGYPDGTFSGKRAMTRYEFALALSRAIPVICDTCKNPTTGPTGNYITEEQLNERLKGLPQGVSQSDIDALKKSIDEFRNELSQMGVDLDALKRDVASLEERVAALEAEARRLKITSKLTFFGVGTSSKNGRGIAVDRDNRPMDGDNSLLENVGFVRDADIILNYEASGAKAKVVLNGGNYIGGYLSSLTNFNLTPSGNRNVDNGDSVNLFLAYGEVPVLGADLTVGRFPIQFTKWTLKKFDVDTYTENWKTDDGNYYMDGGKAAWTWGNVDILAFAAKNNNQYGGELVSQPFGAGNTISALVSGTGYSAGLLQGSEQSSGAHVGFGLGPTKVGLTYLRVGTTPGSDPLFDEAQIYGADLGFDVGNIKVGGSWTTSDTFGRGPSGNVTKNSDAWEVMGQGALGGLGIAASYVSIDDGFSAPGDWRRIGRWQNPTGIKGPEVGLKYGLNERMNLYASGAWYKSVDNSTGDDKLRHYKAGVNFGLTARGGLGFEAEWVKWDLAGNTDKSDERYYTFSYNQLLTDNTKLRLLYQIADWNAGAPAAPYGADYRGNVAVAQVSMDF